MNHKQFVALMGSTAIVSPPNRWENRIAYMANNRPAFYLRDGFVPESTAAPVISIGDSIPERFVTVRAGGKSRQVFRSDAEIAEMAIA